jgi:hypothetical protein
LESVLLPDDINVPGEFGDSEKSALFLQVSNGRRLIKVRLQLRMCCVYSMRLLCACDAYFQYVTRLQSRFQLRLCCAYTLRATRTRSAHFPRKTYAQYKNAHPRSARASTRAERRVDSAHLPPISGRCGFCVELCAE